jgi:hypothetical protein
MASLLEHCRKGHNANGRKAHHPNRAVLSACFSRERVELWVSNVDEENQHSTTLARITERKGENYLISEKPKEIEAAGVMGDEP